MNDNENWFVYIVECADGTLYTGCTNNLDRRIANHNSGKGAHYTKVHGPVILRYHELLRDRSAAQKREYAIKKLTRGQKMSLFLPESSQ